MSWGEIVSLPRVLFVNDFVLKRLVLQIIFWLSNDILLLRVKASLFPGKFFVFQQYTPAKKPET